MTVAIIGAGPAGAATALSLLQHSGLPLAQVSLYHRGERGRWPVGETLPPAAHSVLSQLGVDQLLSPSRHRPCPGSLSVWGGSTPVANDFMLEPNGTGYHLDRTRFEADLLAAAERRGACLCSDHRLRQVRSKGEGFELTFENAAQQRSVCADFVVDATGQAASFARRLSVARNRVDEVVSLYACSPIPPGVTLPDYTHVEATAGGWWYLARMPGDQCVLSFTTDAQYLAQERLHDLHAWRKNYREARWLNGVLPEAKLQPGALHRAPACSAILTVCIGERWLAVGDAACSYDAITSAGITKSLLQGKQAGEAIAGYLTHAESSLERYQQSVFNQFNHYIGLRDQLYRQETRFPGAGFWRRRLL